MSKNKLTSSQRHWLQHVNQLEDEQDKIQMGQGRPRIYAPNHSYSRKARNPDYPREFIAWDGEGTTVGLGVPQPYVLFGNSKPGERLKAERGLSTVECFDLLLFSKQMHPWSIFIGFSINYDVNQMLCDLPVPHLKVIHKQNKVTWNGYRVHWFPGKWLYVRRIKDQQSVIFYDVFGFFQSSFIVACEKFLGENDPEIGQIREGKARRASFLYSELETFIIPYWERELSLLVRLAESLRNDLDSAGIKISSWHGPGAVASKVFSLNHIKDYLDRDIPRSVNVAAQYAYAGGRFEQFRCGHYPHRVYEYDINSAYPSGIVGLPNLRNGAWEHVETFEPDSFGVWHIDHDGRETVRELYVEPQPLFCRHQGGHISYPTETRGYYWTPEAALVSTTSILGGWVFRGDGTLPFEFVREMYDRRREWKLKGISAEKALKLALNSMYGKMAQRIGGAYRDGRVEIPAWHQLEWAGWVTSAARAKLYRAILLNPSSVIATETDAIFTISPIDLPVSKNLGEWELTEFDNITYIQSGFYYAEQGDTLTCKYRGLDKDRQTGEPKGLPYRQVLDILSGPGRFGGTLPPFFGTTSRYVGLGIGLTTGATWRSWETNTREVTLGGSGKRTHIDRYWDDMQQRYVFPCPECAPHSGRQSYGANLHHCALAPRKEGYDSSRHSLPWEREQGEDALLQEELDQIDRWQPQHAE